MNYKELLNKKYYSYEWSISDPLDYSTLVWIDQRIEKPSKEFLDRKIAFFKKELLNNIHTKRRNEYPDHKDFLDAWVKNDQEALEEYRQQCLNVKLKYPKPE
jgi:hypothetical protein